MRKNLIAAGTSILMIGASSACAQGIQITPAGSTPTVRHRTTACATLPSPT
jgi:hypothetical protein